MCNYEISFAGTAGLIEAFQREMQRRSDTAIDHASSLPPDVVSVLTQCDALEKQREELYHEANKKLSDSVQRFFNKLEAEEKKYRARMEELEVRNSF